VSLSVSDSAGAVASVLRLVVQLVDLLYSLFFVGFSGSDVLMCSTWFIA